jgi:hypothetical protein
MIPALCFNYFISVHKKHLATALAIIPWASTAIAILLREFFVDPVVDGKQTGREFGVFLILPVEAG